MYDDYDYYDDNEEDEREYGAARDAYEQINEEYIDLKDPKNKFAYEMSKRFHIYDLTEEDQKIITGITKTFSEKEYINYNVDGIVVGYIVYKNKFNAKKIKKLSQEHKKNASSFDMIRYGRLWEKYLSKD